MKKKFLFIAICFLFFSMLATSFAQNSWECETIGPETDFLLEIGKLDYTSSLTKVKVRVFLHVIRRSDGNGGLTNTQVANSIDLMKMDFDDRNINFSIIGSDFIDNDIYYNFNSSLFSSLINENSHADAIDIYFLPEGISFGKAAGIPGLALVLGGDYAISSVLSHEMGHCLGLWHTHSGRGCGDFTNCAEEIDGSNCQTCGDLVCDTPADPCLKNLIDRKCQYIGPPQFNPDIRNIMSYTPPQCMTHFTNGQFDRMFTMIETSPILQGVIEPEVVVTVDQRLSTNTSVDSISIWNKNKFITKSVPFDSSMEIGDTLILQSSLKILFSEKFYNWNGSDSIINQKLFKVDSNTTSIISNFFQSKQNVVIQNEFLSVNNFDPEYDVVSFKDPWLIDYPDPLYGNNKRNRGMAAPFKSRPSPFHPDYTTSYNGDVYQGVFLNQGYNQGQWTPPYYSVRAQAQWVLPFHGQDITWYFQNWDGEHVVFRHPEQLETPLVFQADGAVARANYKGHLVTGVNAPEANNSRQVLRDRLGNWHMVYEDNGNIYYTRSYDNGATWSAEKRLNAIIPGAVNSKPALGYSYELNLPVVVWNRQISSNHFPVFVYSLPGNNWSQEISAESLVVSRENSTPAVTFVKLSETDNRAYVICKNIKHEAGLALLYVPMDNFEEQTAFDFVKEINHLNGTNDSSKNPSICSDYTDPIDGRMYFAWEQDGKIVYNYYDAEQQSQPTHPLWSSPEGMEGSSDAYPSIAYNGNGLVHIAWQHFDGETGTSFRHQFFDATDPNVETPVNQVSLRGVNLTRPSIGCSTDGQTVAAVVQAGSQWRWLLFDDDQWTLSEEGINGNVAGINANGTNFMAAWVNVQNGLPYLVKNTLLPQSARLERDNRNTATDYREQLLNLSYLNSLNLRGKALLRLGNVKLQTAGGESEWPFVNPEDSLNTTGFQRTIPITVTPATGSARLHYRVRLEDYHKPPQLLNAPLVRLGIFNPGAAQPLAVLFEVDLNALPNGSHLFEDSLTVDLTPWQNQTVELRMENIFGLSGNNGRKPACIAEQVFRAGGGNNERMLAKTANENENPVLPKAFRLLPNYPNPFNPETRITFELPQASPVRLEIYDMSGRKIKTLVNEEYPAGRYELIWNGRDGQNRPAASGVYLLRLQAGAFRASQKMVLMK